MKFDRVRSAIEERLAQREGPVRMLELGAYIGWSAIKFAPLLPEGSMYVSMEALAIHAAITSQVVALAGLQDRFQILVGEAAELLKGMPDLHPFDIVFIDHAKPAYLPDFQLLEKKGLLNPGCLIIADNLASRGSESYVDYIKSLEGTRYKTELVTFQDHHHDIVGISTLI
eukprot:Protomagalhaensia_wolfi_Nauph_80__1824@NODE_2139_length_1201_cov_31_347676_g1674_i0_p1_GENE_NODE_2139_length_1201_cov_31_347676_g1674_i0NODE_2139_length_1201_cov_31_347676_g1674_i0_p1_ORF_typecomplete_len171_score28_66Methyltransf_3/PF01596_17/3_4e29Methyltransf_24/PF13578_6/1_4e13Cons_hypoth95/PF03602_15/1_7e09PCMT/PF01135_19/0_0026Methyltrans_SAM/PF10672_9/0_12Methyltransf_30/PF05430_11/0_2_NODE_2139_length_1201_cov_31_347676_g1674_i0252764